MTLQIKVSLSLRAGRENGKRKSADKNNRYKHEYHVSTSNLQYIEDIKHIDMKNSRSDAEASGYYRKIN